MSVIRHAVKLLLILINKLDGLMSTFGLRLYPLTRESILKGLPKGAKEELEKPDVKPFADALFQDEVASMQIKLPYRMYLTNLFRNQTRFRLQINETVENIPDILKVPIKKPVFIIGPYRTGTTFLHWLLATDARFRSPMMWEQSRPCPPGPVADFRKDNRYQAVERLTGEQGDPWDGLLGFLNPDQYAAHPFAADKPEECLTLFLRSYISILHFGTAHHYTDVVFGHAKSDIKALYKFLKVQMQVLGWGHKMDTKTYLGKAPNHLCHLDTLTKVFPDARLIFNFRRLDEMVASTLSLFKHLQDPVGFDTSTEQWKNSMLKYLRQLLNNGLKHLENIESTNKGIQVHFVPYKNLVSDPLGEVRKLYDFLEMDLTPEAESAMISYLNNDPKKKKYGKHKYKEGVHLSKEVLEREFKEYIEIMSKKVGRNEII